MNTMPYLFAAFAAIWIVLALFLLSIYSREKALGRDIQRLQKMLDKL